MSIFSRNSSPLQPVKPLSIAEIDLKDAVIELIYAGHDLASHLTIPTDHGPECFCGASMHSYQTESEHKRFCPVARYMAAVERVRKVAL